MISLEEALQLAGIKATSLVGGFAGSVVSLVANKQLTFWQSIFTLMSGLLVSGYVTPALSDHYHMSRALENMLAFFFGVIGMYLVVGILRFFQDFAANPIAALKNLLSLRYFYKQQEAAIASKPTDDATGTKPTN